MIEASSSVHIADARPQNWVERFLPHSLLPYAQLMRLERPIGWWLLLLPCWWGLALAQIAAGQSSINWWYAILFFVGAVVMRSAGCVVNDIVDRDIDAQVERTRIRPLASGRATVFEALALLAVLCAIGLLVLLQFNWTTVVTGVASLVIVVVYPFMKRITYYPQAILGLAFNWGALLGWTAIHNRLDWPAVLLYFGGIAWTLAYDTIYAHQDKEDDILIGVKSTALKFGDASIYWLGGFFALSLVLIDAAFWVAGTSLVPHVAIAGAALHGAWQVARFDGNNSTLCLKLFKSNRTFGLIVLAGLILDLILP
jgi:4-hydroxybenzoate polyprenyltransferase